MYLRIIFLLFFTSLVGCAHYSNEPYSNLEVNKKKPVVAIVPILDKANHELPWNVGNEILHGVTSQFKERRTLSVLPEKVVLQAFPEVSTIDYFTKELAFFEAFRNLDVDYVVLAELFEHERVPYIRGKIQPIFKANGKVDNVIKMKLRIKVVNLKESSPKVVHFEIVESNHMIQRHEDYLDYSKINWKNEHYLTTGVGISHDRLIKEVRQRIEYAALHFR